jgi:5-methylcytosine-specific restriction endonuclease McrA
MIRRCNTCLADLPFVAFKRDRRRSTGYAAVCKKCSRGAAAMWRHINGDHIRQYDATRDATRIRIRIRPASHRLAQRAWEIANPTKMQTIWRNKRAKRSLAVGCHSIADVERIVRLQRGRCAYCKCKIGPDRHIDHIKALSRGGSNWPSNLQALCPSCNIRKNAKDPIVFAQQLGLLV